MLTVLEASMRNDAFSFFFHSRLLHSKSLTKVEKQWSCQHKRAYIRIPLSMVNIGLKLLVVPSPSLKSF